MLREKFAGLKLPAFNFSLAELEKKGHTIFFLLAMTALSYALVGISYDVASIRLLKVRAVSPVTVDAIPLTAKEKPPADSYAVIAQRNLFGTTDKAVAEKKLDTPPVVEGPDISLVLEVKGTVAGDGKDGFAVIEERGKNKQLLYKVGNVVAGAKLIRIMRHAVVFQVGDKERTLKISQTTEGPLLASRPASPPPVATGTARSGAIVINRDEVTASLKDMGTMLSQAQIRPYYSEGVPDGFMISGIKPGSIYEKIGLVEGDIVQGTDDRKLTTADDLTALYNSMKSGSSMTLKIKRRGQQESLHYVFR